MFDGSYLHIVTESPWLSLGEGPHIGHPAVLITLHDLNARSSNPEDPKVSLPWLVDRVQRLRGNTRLVVVTGGEPLRQEIRPLCRTLWMKNHNIQIETAGEYWLEGIQQWAEVVCSPKTPTVHEQVQRYARCFKYKVDVGMNFDKGIPAGLAAPTRERCPVYYLPMDTPNFAPSRYSSRTAQEMISFACELRNLQNMKLAAELAIKHGGIATVQIHKMMNQR
jgi:7-carboxy-7-deazaguanine synthase